MAEIRYKQSRILARGIRRLTAQSREEFKENVLRLRRHFEQFNLDASEICQWLMSLRPGGKKGNDDTRIFWEFILEPQKFIAEAKEEFSDRYRRMVFDVVAGIEEEKTLDAIPHKSDLKKSINSISHATHSETAKNLIGRLSHLHKAHRQILIKAAAEWIVSRYWRGIQNWERQYEEWKKEKDDWESNNPELTEDVRSRFNNEFKELGIAIKRPRICSWEKLKEVKDNCLYAGERIGNNNHGPLCIKYRDFLKNKKMTRSKEKYFIENAKSYIQHRKSMARERAFKLFNRQNPKAKWFQKLWGQYLQELGINEETISSYNWDFPHCLRLGEECLFNIHTEDCKKYSEFLQNNVDLQPLEPLYREWRAEFLGPPKKPSFKYPSKRNLPMPKIFGGDFYKVDFDNSIIQLRLDDMPVGEFIPFGFTPWPIDYNPQATDIEITSVHISFVGTRARSGFRFEVPHCDSRFSMRQEVIDELRSRKYPRQAQDNQFLDEARKLFIDSFTGGSKDEMKIMAVDLGTVGAFASLLKGDVLQKTTPLKIIKIDKIYEEFPRRDDKKKKGEKTKQKGLSKDHLSRHIKEEWAEGAREIAEARKSEEITLGDHDMRRLSLHIRWMIRDWVRLNVSQIIETAENNGVDLIVFESMRGFRLPGYDQIEEDKKRRLAFFAHGSVRRKTIEKAVERGMRVITVPYFKSSRFCSKCHDDQKDEKTWLANKRKHKFECENKKCGFKANSDENAAIVLGKVFWGHIKLPSK